jgi:ribosomal protein L7Ae-like RNA K-turn-binding protein
LDEQKLRSAVAFSARSGKLQSGDSAVRKSIAMGRAKLVLIDESAAQRTQKNIGELCRKHRIEFFVIPSVYNMVQWAGRDTSKILCLEDKNLAGMALDALK